VYDLVGTRKRTLHLFITPSAPSKHAEHHTHTRITFGRLCTQMPFSRCVLPSYMMDESLLLCLTSSDPSKHAEHHTHRCCPRLLQAQAYTDHFWQVVYSNALQPMCVASSTHIKMCVWPRQHIKNHCLSL